MASRLGGTAIVLRALAGIFVAVLSTVLPAGPARGDGTPGKEEPLKVVVHINFADGVRQGQGLKNIENILKAASSAGVATEVEAVCHGDGIVLLEKGKTAHSEQVDLLLKKGVRFAACENTMRQRSIPREALTPGASTVPSGAFEVVRRQQQGYSYFKP